MASAERRLLLDTNVVVAALLWRGPPWQLMSRAIDEGFVLLSSPALLDELRSTLSKPKLRRRLELLQADVETLLRRYEPVVELVQPANVPRVVTTDADDDEVLAAALTGQAELIVSGDRRDLLPLGSHAGIPIVTVRDALDRLFARTG